MENSSVPKKRLLKDTNRAVLKPLNIASKTVENRSKLPTPKLITFSFNGLENQSRKPIKLAATLQKDNEARKRKLKDNAGQPAVKRTSVQQKAARRSVNNALKLSRSVVAAKVPPATTTNKRGVVKTAPRVNIPPRPVKPAAKTTFNASANSRPVSAKSRPVSARPKVSTGASSESGLSSANSSISSVGSSSGVVKKIKRKPWDLKGQVEDLKEELAIAKKEKSTINDILKRLDVLEEEKQCFKQQKTELSSDVIDLRQKLDSKEHEIEEKQRKLDEKQRLIVQFEEEREDLLAKLRVSRESCHELHMSLEKKREELEALQAQLKIKDEICERNQNKIVALQSHLEEKNSTIDRLDSELRIGESDRKQLLNAVQELKGNIRVFCRVRPMLPKEVDEFGEMNHIEFVGNDDKSVAITNDANKPSTYSFDKVFGPSASQANVFGEVSQLVESALDGYNVCIFAYGQTGAGKTFTMEGGDQIDTELDGIIPRSLKLVFEKIKEKEKFSWKYNLSVQHIEIYLEALHDLLQPPNDNSKLEIKTVTSGKKQQVWVKNLTSHEVNNFNEVRSLLKQSKRKRATAATAANERSSRSHSVFILQIAANNEDTDEKFESSLNLIDLAGSERVAETGAAGMRLKEAQKINGSLNQLSNVISALANKDSHVPYRNSKLTFLLMNSLGGNSKTLMVVNVNPTKRACGETINTLRFATTVNKCCIGTAQKAVKF